MREHIDSILDWTFRVLLLALIIAMLIFYLKITI